VAVGAASGLDPGHCSTAVSIHGVPALLAACVAGIAGALGTGLRAYRSSVPVSSGKMAPAAIPRTRDMVPAA
jgi:hypothetical protein